MRPYSLFDATTGEGIAQGAVQHMEFDKLAEPGQVIIEGNYIRTHYYDPGAQDIAERSPMGTSIDGTLTVPGGTVTVTGIPVGTTATVGDDVVQVDDGILTLTTQTIGRYMIHLDHFQYLPEHYEVNCE